MLKFIAPLRGIARHHAMAITSYLYDAQGEDQKVELSAETLRSIGQQRLLWIDVDARDSNELNHVAGELGLAENSLRTLVKLDGAPLENYGNYIQLSVETAPTTADPASHSANRRRGVSRPPTRLDFVIGKEWILTVHEGDIEFINTFRDQDRTATTTRAQAAPRRHHGRQGRRHCCVQGRSTDPQPCMPRALNASPNLSKIVRNLEMNGTNSLSPAK